MRMCDPVRLRPECRPLRRAPSSALPTAALLTVALLVACAVPAAAQPSISHTMPSAMAPGAATDIVLYGGNLAQPTGIWWGLPAEAQLTPDVDQNGTQPGQVSYRVAVPADVPVGIYGMRIATGGGISNLRLVMVDDLPTDQDNGSNKSLDAAQAISLPVAVEGTTEPESFDYYKFDAAAGQAVTVEVVARRLGYPLDPVVRLLNSEGRELAYSDDEPGIGADARFAVTIPESGTYYLEVRDIRYQGGATHRYRLRVGNFPLATATYPLGGRRDSEVRLNLAGDDAVPALPWTIPADVRGGRMRVGMRYPGGAGSAMASIAVGSRTEQVELEPNDAAETASPITLPSTINGRFDAPKDRDYYQFEAKQGQRWRFGGMARSLGAASDLYMRMYAADGAQLAEVVDSGADEGVLDWTAPADGVYRLMVEDLLRRGGPEMVYRIAVEPYQPGFALAVEADKFDAPAGGVFAVKVTSQRRDYNGPITLSVEGAGEGLSLAGNVIAEGANETLLRVTLPTGMQPGHFATIHIVGRAKIGETDFEAVASTLGPLRAAYNGWAWPPDDLVGSIGLGVGPAFPEYFQLTTAPGGAIPLPQVIAAATFAVKAERSHNFDDKIDLAIDGLPEGVSAKVAPIEKGKPEATIELSGPVALAEGDYPIRITGSATFQHQPRRVTLADVVLRVVPPIQVELAPAGNLVPGGKQTIAVKLVRHGDASGPVTLRLGSLPPGISGPAEFVVPEGQAEAAFELTAADDVALGESLLGASGTVEVHSRRIALASSHVSLRIEKPSPAPAAEPSQTAPAGETPAGGQPQAAAGGTETQPKPTSDE